MGDAGGTTGFEISPGIHCRGAGLSAQQKGEMSLLEHHVLLQKEGSSALDACTNPPQHSVQPTEFVCTYDSTTSSGHTYAIISSDVVDICDVGV